MKPFHYAFRQWLYFVSSAIPHLDHLPMSAIPPRIEWKSCWHQKNAHWCGWSCLTTVLRVCYQYLP
ncbi:Uncharacterised protein [Vibrio cholerae]|nr:Uncharacterised protein [Vibrio cholerae]